jgi:hypothetical protein
MIFHFYSITIRYPITYVNLSRTKRYKNFSRLYVNVCILLLLNNLDIFQHITYVPLYSVFGLDNQILPLNNCGYYIDTNETSVRYLIVFHEQEGELMSDISYFELITDNCTKWVYFFIL